MTLVDQLQIELALLDSEQEGPSRPPIEVELRFRPEQWLTDVCGVKLVEPHLTFVRDVATSWLHLAARDRKARDLEWEAWQKEQRPDLIPWDGESVIPNIFPLQGGHGQGKSVDLAMLMHWLYSCEPELLGGIYAPEVNAVSRLTWRYIDRVLSGSWAGPRWGEATSLLNHRMGGQTSPKLQDGSARSVTTTATKKGVSVQGGHAPAATDPDKLSAARVDIFEEARGISEPNVYQAIRSIVDKGRSLWFLAENPEDANSPSQKLDGPAVRRYVFDVMASRNVVEGREVIPGAVNRAWVEAKLEGKDAWADEVIEHDPDLSTFELPWRPGKIYAPHGPWWWRVWGVPPPSGSRFAAVSPGRYRRAVQLGSGGKWREIFNRSNPVYAQLGVDVARSDAGQGDMGAIGRRWRGCLEVRAEIFAKHSDPYVNVIASELQELLDGGCRRVSIRVDDGGGYGGAVADAAEKLGILDRFDDWEILLVGFGNRSTYLTEPESWYDAATQMYADLEDDLTEYVIVDPHHELEEDLCGRRRVWAPSSDGGGGKRDVQKLEPKEQMHKRTGRSPDRGDALALACGRWRSPDRNPHVEARDGRRWGLPDDPRMGGGDRGRDGRPIPPWERGPGSRWGRG